MHKEISYKCFNCNHTFNVDSFRMNVTHCPNCECKLSISKIECEHKHQVLSSKTTTFYADGGQSIQEVAATFYCEKCLNIQCHKKRIEKWG